VNADELKSLQAPLKERYKAEPEAAVITLRAQGRAAEGIACKVETGRALVTAGLHPATGGDGTLACSGDMLLEALVACAGISVRYSILQLDEATWDRVVDVHLKGTFLCCQAVIPAMRVNRYGRIINLGSIIGKNGGNARPWIDATEQDRSSNLAYGASKAGVHAITAFLARELAPDGITVNAVAPGPIVSAMTTQFPASLRALIPVGRMGRAEEVAAAIAFLAGPDAAFITGEVLDVNGGMWSD